MIVKAAGLAGLEVIEPNVRRDDRGRFYELWQAARYDALVTSLQFAQDNVSVSRRGTIRGLHFQFPNEQGKLLTVLSGAVSDVVVDVRRGSATFGQCHVLEMSAENAVQLWVPPGFAHGFQALADDTVLLYKVTAPYSPADERTISPHDPDLGIAWPLPVTAISPKDAAAARLRDLPLDHLPE